MEMASTNLWAKYRLQSNLAVLIFSLAHHIMFCAPSLYYHRRWRRHWWAAMKTCVSCIYKRMSILVKVTDAFHQLRWPCLGGSEMLSVWIVLSCTSSKKTIKEVSYIQLITTTTLITQFYGRYQKRCTFIITMRLVARIKTWISCIRSILCSANKLIWFQHHGSWFSSVERLRKKDSR